MNEDMIKRIGKDVVFIGAKKYDSPTVVVPYGVTKITMKAFAERNDIKKVILPDTVVEIEKEAFYGSSVEEVILGNGITEIKDSTFGCCKHLKSINFPDSVESIGKSAFDFCKSLERVVIPPKVKAIKENTFFGCSSLKEIVFHDGVEQIDERSFWGCGKVSKLVVPGSVKEIGRSAFSETSIRELVLQEGVETIGVCAFCRCDDLEELNCPKTLRTISDRAFGNCQKLKDVTFNEGLEKIDNLAFGNTCISEVTIPQSVKYLGRDIFDSCLPKKVHCKRVYKNMLFSFSVTDDVIFVFSDIKAVELFINGKQYLIPSALLPDLANSYSLMIEDGTFSEEKLLEDMISICKRYQYHDSMLYDFMILSIIDYAISIMKYKKDDCKAFYEFINESVEYLLSNKKEDRLKELLDIAGPDILPATAEAVLRSDCGVEIKSIVMEKTKTLQKDIFKI